MRKSSSCRSRAHLYKLGHAILQILELDEEEHLTKGHCENCSWHWQKYFIDAALGTALF
jgi:hypothetical protein